MANEVDNDRISATTKNENVVDLLAYKAAAAERKVSQAYSSIHWPALGTLFLICILAFFVMRRI